MAQPNVVQSKEAAKPIELNFVQMLALIPPAIKDHLLSDANTAARKGIYEASALTAADRKVALDVEIDVFFGQIPVAEFGDALYSFLGWPDDKEPQAALLAARILGRLMLPAEAYLGDVSNAIRATGFDPADFPKERIKFRVLNYDEAVEAIISAVPLVSEDKIRRDRVAKVLDSFVHGVRVEAQLKEALTKPTKVGGPGLADVGADAVIAAAKALAIEAFFVEKIELPTAVSKAVGSWDKTSIAAAYAGSDDERREIASFQAAMQADDAGEKLLFTRFADAIIAPGAERPNPTQVVAGALLLAAKGNLLKSLEDERVEAAFREHLTFAGFTEAIAALDKDISDPDLAEPFMVFLLRDRAALLPNDAARFALRIGNALKKAGFKGLTMRAAFDQDAGEFVWETPSA